MCIPDSIGYYPGYAERSSGRGRMDLLLQAAAFATTSAESKITHMSVKHFGAGTKCRTERLAGFGFEPKSASANYVVFTSISGVSSKAPAADRHPTAGGEEANPEISSAGSV